MWWLREGLARGVVVTAAIALAGSVAVSVPDRAEAAVCADPDYVGCVIVPVHVSAPKPDHIIINVEVHDAGNPDEAPVRRLRMSNGQPDDLMALPPGNYKFKIDGEWHGGKSFHTARVVNVPATSSVTLRATRWGRVNADMVDANGVGIPFVRLIFHDRTDPTEVVARADSEIEGQASLGSAGLGRLARIVDPTGRFKSRWVSYDEVAGDGSPNGSDVVLQKNATMSSARFETGDSALVGRISSPQRLSSSQRVYLFLAEDDTNFVDMSGVYTTSDEPEDRGTYSFRFIGPGRYKLKFGDGHWIGGASHKDATVFAVGDEEEVRADFDVPAHGSVKGHVVSTRGTPLQPVLVSAYRKGQLEPIAHTVPDQFGKFEFSGLLQEPTEFRVTEAEHRYLQRWYGGGSDRSTAVAVTPEFPARIDLGDIEVRDGLVALTAPTMVGPRESGRLLVARSGKWSLSGTYSRRWLRDGRPIAGATGRAYRLRSVDKGHRISFRMTAQRTGYVSATALSADSARIR